METLPKEGSLMTVFVVAMVVAGVVVAVVALVAARCISFRRHAKVQAKFVSEVGDRFTLPYVDRALAMAEA